ncbi:MAG: uracil-DNA glycosylase family protein [Acidobacteriota bacterium]
MKRSSRADFDAHLGSLQSCRACPGVQSGAVCSGVYGARVMLIGQAPGPREPIIGKPFAHTAGKRLFAWFAVLGVDEETFRRRVHIASVIRCFPGKDSKGGDRVPDSDEIARCGAHLDRELRMNSPKLVIAVGTLAAHQLTGDSTLIRTVGLTHRVTRAGRTFDVIVLPHPSGRSTWLNNPVNRQLLDRSLGLVAAHPAFERTFSDRP